MNDSDSTLVIGLPKSGFKHGFSGFAFLFNILEKGRRFLTWDVARIGFAVILLVAAFLKAHQAATDVATQAGVHGPLWLKALAVNLELALATWLLTNVASQWAHRFSLGAIIAFIGVSVHELILGKPDCGCFGRLAVPPAMTLVLDVLMGIVLWFCPPPRSVERAGAKLAIARTALAVFILSIVGGSLTVWMASAASDTTVDVVLVEPASLSGRKFPVQHVDWNSHVDLDEGAWTVIIYDHDCPKCEEFLDRRLRQPSVETGSQNHPRTAAIDVSPEQRPPLRSEFVHGVLRPNVLWAASVPTELHLREGVVVDVRVH